MITVLMMPAKMATLDILKMKVFWTKRYDVLIFVHDVNNIILSLSHDSNYIVDVVMCPMFSKYNSYMREVFITSIL